MTIELTSKIKKRKLSRWKKGNYQDKKKEIIKIKKRELSKLKK